MSNLLIASLLLFFGARSQHAAVDTEISAPYNMQVKAILQKDSATLRKIWAPRFMVNSPRNNAVFGGQVERVMAGTPAYSSYLYEIEKMLIREKPVITMSNETVVPVIGNPKGGQTIKRRYPQRREKINGCWVLIARHASEICQH